MLSAHVLDLARGMPAAGVEVALYRAGSMRRQIARAITDADGRIASPFGGRLEAGWYELVFEVGAYFAVFGVESLYGEIPIRFRIAAGDRHYHIPLLVAPWGYSTYRGS
jgi:5-hydroxyisourate hydrolase